MSYHEGPETLAEILARLLRAMQERVKSDAKQE